MFFRKNPKPMMNKEFTELLRISLENDKLMVEVFRGIMKRMDRLEQNVK